MEGLSTQQSNSRRASVSRSYLKVFVDRRLNIRASGKPALLPQGKGGASWNTGYTSPFPPPSKLLGVTNSFHSMGVWVRGAHIMDPNMAQADRA